MFRFAVLVALVAVSYGYTVSFNEVRKSFEQFKADHGVVYADAKEEAHRLRIFAQNFQKIKSHNAEADKGLHSYWLGVNKYADLTSEEFSAHYLGLKGSVRGNEAALVHKSDGQKVPESVDWRKKGAVTGVKDQGQCGSCWAFSTVAAIEGANFLKNGKLVSLSEQNLVDCDISSDQGCNGGWMYEAFQYVIKNKGIDTESAYPYEGVDNICRFSSGKVGATISAYANITSGDENNLLSAVAQQPVAVAIDATPVQLYDHGIIDDSTSCGSSLEYLNHGVAAVGYGTEGSKDFWIVKNSWGSSWGEEGYFRLERGANLCGIATCASYPIA